MYRNESLIDENVWLIRVKQECQMGEKDKRIMYRMGMMAGNIKILHVYGSR